MDKFAYIKVMSDANLNLLRRYIGDECRRRELKYEDDWTTVTSKKNRPVRLTSNVHQEGVHPRFEKKEGKMYQYNRQVSPDETDSVLLRPRNQRGQLTQKLDSNELRTFLESFGPLKDFETTNRGYFVAEFQDKENARTCFEKVKSQDFNIVFSQSNTSCKVNCRLIKRFQSNSTDTNENPSTENPSTENPSTENPSTENPSTENPSTENQIVDNSTVESSAKNGEPAIN